MNKKTIVTVEKKVDVVRNSKFAWIAIIWLFVSVVLIGTYLKFKGGFLKWP